MTAACAEQHESIVGFLARTASYSPRPARVDVLETHISHVFLTDRLALKLKKPVRFDFVDYSTLEARRIACEDEVRLNRRLAPDVYLGVSAITRDSEGRLSVDGPGVIVDYVVRMRRIDTSLALDAMLKTGRLSAAQVDGLARRLAAFYTAAAPLTVRPDEYRRRVDEHVRDNLSVLANPVNGLDRDSVWSVHAAQARLLATASHLFDARVCDGRIIDGHGDLRPEHIILEQPPIVFDCVEFSSALRKVDVADELAFLAMECDRLGAEWVGQRVFEAYLRTSGDRPPNELIAFYKCYRACVRAKVAVLRSRQLATDARQTAVAEAAADIDLARTYADSLGRPPLVVVSGLVGTGKSTLARVLAELLVAEWIRSDGVRRELFAADDRRAEAEAERYSGSGRARVYEEMFRRASRALDAGLPAVLDATFLRAADLRAAMELAERAAAPLLIVRCECPAEVARRRIADRLAEGRDPSEARPELYDLQLRDVEPIPGGAEVCRVDTTLALAAQLEPVLTDLGGACGPAPAPLPAARNR